MDERLQKKWNILGSLLTDASVQIRDTEYYSEVCEFISQNEFELALDVLEEAGVHTEVNEDYWWNLKKAAEVMGLRERLNFLRQKRREASRERT